MSIGPGAIVGHYKIIEQVGRGGMATVYRAYQDSLKREVAIKVLPEFFAEDPEFRERFAREAAAIARLRHPNVVTVFDFGEEEGTSYIVTEFLGGETLASRMGRNHTVAEVAAVLGPIAEALDYAHAHGVVHRDVKPSNIMITDGVPVLTDFGLAQIAGSIPPLTRTGTPVGTPEYMAPEQASGGTAGPSVDHYALAVIAYEMLTGEVPFTGDSPLAVLLAHVNRPTRPPSSVNTLLDYRADEVLVRGLAKAPADRFATAAQFVEELRRSAGPARPREPGPRASSDSTDRSPAEPVVDVTATVARDAAPSTPSEPRRSPRLEGERLTASSLRKRAVSESVQHPATLLTVALAMLAVGYRLILSPVLGWGAWAAAFALAAGAGAILSFAWRYRVELEINAAAIRTELEERQQESEREELASLHELLRSGFAAIGSAQGLRVFEQLTTEYEQLQPALQKRSYGDPLSMSLVPALALTAYRRGLTVLVDALELMTAAESSGRDRLLREIAALESEIEALRGDERQAERLRLREGILASHRERLRKLDELTLHADQLLFEAQRCEASLSGARIDLAAVRIGSTESSVDSVIRALQKTIDQAKEVQEEIKALGL